jgi:hypothetical protein
MFKIQHHIREVLLGEELATKTHHVARRVNKFYKTLRITHRLENFISLYAWCYLINYSDYSVDIW